MLLYCALLRKKEFEQAALQFFCAPSEHRQWYYHWQKKRLRWWKQVRHNLCLWYTHSDTSLATSCSHSSPASCDKAVEEFGNEAKFM